MRGSRGKRGGERAFWGRGGVLASLSTTCRGESKETARAEANQVANDGAQVGQRFGRRRPATGVVAKRKIGIFPELTGSRWALPRGCRHDRKRAGQLLCAGSPGAGSNGANGGTRGRGRGSFRSESHARGPSDPGGAPPKSPGWRTRRAGGGIPATRGAHLPGGPLQRRHSSTWLLSKFIGVGLNRSLTQCSIYYI